MIPGDSDDAPIILLNERLLPVRYTPLLWRPLVALIILQTGAGGHKTGGRTGGREQVKKSYRTSPQNAAVPLRSGLRKTIEV